MLRRLILIFALCALAVWAGFQRSASNRSEEARRRLERQLALATEENERLRSLVTADEKTRSFEKTRAARGEIEREVESIRGLKFLEPVQYASVSRAEIKNVLTKALAEDISDAQLEEMSRAWTRLGLFRQPVRLKETLVDLLGEQVAAFYNHREHKLYMFEDASLERSQDRVVLAHELVHALQDQHYHLLPLLTPLLKHDDRELAAMALIEGDATEVMTVYMAQHLSMRAVLESASSLLSTQMAQLQKAPRVLRDRLMFPYLQGKNFTAAIRAAGGDEAVNGCYGKLPASTAQIVHPEDYFKQTQPVAIEWKETAFRGAKPAYDNAAGVFGIRALMAEWLEESAAKTAGEGWLGDRWLWFAEGDALVWKTVWRGEEEAAAFASAEEHVLAMRAGSGRGTRVRREAGHAVLVIDAPNDETAAALEQQFAAQAGFSPATP